MFRSFFGRAILLGAVFLMAGAAKGEETVKTLAHFHDFKADKSARLPVDWETWSPRAEIAPRFSMDVKGGRTGKGALRIEGGGNAAAVGAWTHRIGNIVAGKTYRFSACYRAENVPNAIRSVSARLVWLDAGGERARPPEYALNIGTEGDWTRVEYVTAAPENARSVGIELALNWAAKGVVWWDDIAFQETPPPKGRIVRAMTVYHRPRNTKSAAESVEAFCKIVEGAAAQKPDIVCLPEGISLVGNGKSYPEVCETVPGPTTKRLGEVAKQLHTYIVAGIYERVGSLIYNTAVLIGRKGELVGTYRKTHLPREEVEGGLTPGDSYPVFLTDFGKVGMMICWDVQFPEAARTLALHGAEMILLPIWGGSETLAKARAIENHVFLISSSYDMKTFLVDPAGEVLGEANAENPVAVAEIDLDRKILQPWLGDMKPRTWKERRGDIPLK